MNDEQFRALKEGDVVRHKIGSQGFIVTSDYGDSKIITRTLIISNPREWDLIVDGAVVVDRAEPEGMAEHEPKEGDPEMTLRDEIREAINKASAESNSNTPDHVLAAYLMDCLAAFDVATNRRDRWYGVAHRPGERNRT